MGTMKTDMSDNPDMSGLCPGGTSLAKPDRTGHNPIGVSVCPDAMAG
jgi:hypothetical protein